MSSAPQNDVPSHSAAISASTPVLVVEFRICESSEFSVCSAVPGNTWRRSLTTLVCTAVLDRTWPAMNSPSSATGMMPSSML